MFGTVLDFRGLQLFPFIIAVLPYIVRHLYIDATPSYLQSRGGQLAQLYAHLIPMQTLADEFRAMFVRFHITKAYVCLRALCAHADS